MNESGLHVPGLDDPGSAASPAYTTVFESVMSAVSVGMAKLDATAAYCDARWVAFLFQDKGDDGRRLTRFRVSADMAELRAWCFKQRILDSAYVYMVLVDRERQVIEAYIHHDPLVDR